MSLQLTSLKKQTKEAKHCFESSSRSYHSADRICSLTQLCLKTGKKVTWKSPSPFISEEIIKGKGIY